MSLPTQNCFQSLLSLSSQHQQQHTIILHSCNSKNVLYVRFIDKVTKTGTFEEMCINLQYVTYVAIFTIFLESYPWSVITFQILPCKLPSLVKNLNKLSVSHQMQMNLGIDCLYMSHFDITHTLFDLHVSKYSLVSFSWSIHYTSAFRSPLKLT